MIESNLGMLLRIGKRREKLVGLGQKSAGFCNLLEVVQKNEQDDGPFGVCED